MKYLQRQNGVAQILMVGLVVVVLVLAGLALWQWQNANKPAASRTPSPVVKATTTPTTTPSPAGELKVTELGFKLTLPVGLADLKYVAQTGLSDPGGNGTFGRASFSTSSLEKTDAS